MGNLTISTGGPQEQTDTALTGEFAEWFGGGEKGVDGGEKRERISEEEKEGKVRYPDQQRAGHN